MKFDTKFSVIFLLTFTIHGYFSVYTLKDIYDKIDKLTSEYPRYASRSEIGKSFEGNSIQVVNIRSEKKVNTAIVIEFGIHAREWASPRSALFLLEQLLANPDYKGFWKNINWYIIPVVNPDGYNYSVTEYGAWRKNRRIIPGLECIGVDLNRNFPVGWGPVADSCELIYSGPHNFSEPETIALRNFMTDLTVKKNVTAYVSVHSCAQTILYPYGYTNSKVPRNLETLKDVGLLMAAAMQKVAGNVYRAKSAGELYVAGGATDDWSYETFAIPLVYTLELGYNTLISIDLCFHPDENHMTSLVAECFAAVGAIAKFVDPSISHGKNLPSSNLTDSDRAADSEPRVYPQPIPVPDPCTMRPASGAFSSFSIDALGKTMLLSFFLDTLSNGVNSMVK